MAEQYWDSSRLFFSTRLLPFRPQTHEVLIGNVTVKGPSAA